MNRVPVIGQNPAYIEEVELDEDEVDPADLTPLISGDTPIVTVPASEDEDVTEDVIEDSDEDKEMEELDKEVEELRKEVIDLLHPVLGAHDPNSHL